MTRLRAGRPVFDSRKGQGSFLFATASRQALLPIQPPTQWAFPWGLADYSRPSSADVKNVWSYTSTSTIRPHGVVLN
jgi:hypothetical protein